jgi:hypothetical protein
VTATLSGLLRNGSPQATLAADVMVNHHLFFADLVLRDERDRVLPACNTDIRRSAPAARNGQPVLVRACLPRN